MSGRKILSTVAEYDREITSLDDAQIKRMNAALDSSYQALERDLRIEYPKMQSLGSLTVLNRKLLIQEQVKEQLNVVSKDRPKYESTLLNSLRSSTESGVGFADIAIKVYDNNFPIVSFSEIPIDALAAQARSGVERLMGHGEKFAGNASAIIEQSLVTGSSVSKVTRALREQLKITKTSAETIARTEIQSAFSAATASRYQRNGVNNFQWIITPSEGTCIFCSARNGSVYPIGTVFPPHPRCRCMQLPWTPQWSADGITEDEFIAEFFERGKKSAEERGLKLNFIGPTPFEKAAGLTRSPTPIWKPGDAPARPVPPVVTVVPVVTEIVEFPDDLEELTVVKQLGGSTGAELVEDAAGRRFVMKKGASAGHIKEEYYADKTYEALGLNVPKSKLYKTSKGPVKLAEFIDGKTIGELKGKAREEAIEKARRGFAADSLLGNWDAVGLGYDNMLVDARGEVFRIDNGGSLRYRAQGKKKGAAWGDYPQELWSLRDPRVNKQTADIFGSLSIGDISDQIEVLTRHRDKLGEGLPKALKTTLQKRLDELVLTRNTARTLLEDKFKDAYTDEFVKHGMGIRNAGISNRMPKSLSQVKKGVKVVDEHGRAFDHLRGENSIMYDLDKYIESVGGDYGMVEDWMKAQAGSSWSDYSKTMKWYLSEQRDVPKDEYFWLGGAKSSEETSGRVIRKKKTREKFDNTFPALHAFNYEMMRNIDFPKRNALTQTIELIRTEAATVMGNSGVTFGKNRKMKRGVAESTSIFKAVEVFGSEKTIQQVPFHRIIGNYFTERQPGSNKSAFMGDGENEFVAMLEDVPFDYVKPKKSKKAKEVKKTQDELDLDDLLSLLDLADSL